MAGNTPAVTGFGKNVMSRLCGLDESSAAGCNGNLVLSGTSSTSNIQLGRCQKTAMETFGFLSCIKFGKC
jgi:hypothetical protein